MCAFSYCFSKVLIHEKTIAHNYSLIVFIYRLIVVESQRRDDDCKSVNRNMRYFLRRWRIGRLVRLTRIFKFCWKEDGDFSLWKYTRARTIKIQFNVYWFMNLFILFFITFVTRFDPVTYNFCLLSLSYFFFVSFSFLFFSTNLNILVINFSACTRWFFSSFRFTQLRILYFISLSIHSIPSSFIPYPSTLFFLAI